MKPVPKQNKQDKKVAGLRDLLNRLRADYPHISFQKGEAFYWSPHTKTVIYRSLAAQPHVAQWSLLHETGHGILGHESYASDFELIQLEVLAWQEAKSLAQRYDITIDPDHIQDCLDTYRDWLHRRSTCPACETVSLQRDQETYECFNCHTQWHVTTARFCRPYRRVKTPN